MGVTFDSTKQTFVFDFEHDGTDDIVTLTGKGSTLNEVLRVLRILNEDNDVTVFSLIGRKDLMAETM